MSEPNWDEIGQRVLTAEEGLLQRQYPIGSAIMLAWRDDSYLGSLQIIYPEFDSELVLLSKTGQEIDINLRDAILRLQPDRDQITADPELDLTGPHHNLRRLDDRLTFMTDEQMLYAQHSLRPIIDDTAKVVLTQEEVLYHKGVRLGRG